MKLLEKWATRGRLKAVGLDVGTYAVKGLVLDPLPAGGWRLLAAGWADVTLQPDTPETLPQRQTDAITRCLAQIPPVWRRWAVCAVSGPESAVRGFTFPPIPLQALAQAVALEAQQICPLDMAHSELDYQLLEYADPKNPKRIGVMAAASRQLIHQRRQIVQHGGTCAALMDVEGLAALNCLSQLEDLDAYETVGLVDLGMTMTHLAVLGPSGQPFIRDILFGGREVISQIASALNKSFTEIQQELWPADQSICPQVLKELYQAVRPLLQNITETIKYVASEEKIAFAQKIYLCGAGATVRPVVELIADVLPAEVSVFNPFKKVHVPDTMQNADLIASRGPEFVVAAGLAMRTI